MTLQDILDALSGSEFSQIDLGSGTGGINPRDFPKVVSSLNNGLADLHTRFRLKNGEIYVQLQTGQLEYALHSNYAVSNTYSLESPLYIQDTATKPFRDDIITIESVWAEDDDGELQPLPLNEVDNKWSLSTPDDVTLLLPNYEHIDSTLELVAGDLVTVRYVKNHRLLVEADWDDPEETVIALPRTHMQALLYFIASRGLTPLGGSRETGHDGNLYATKYEAECLRLKNGGREIVQQHDANKFRMRGFR